MARSKETIYEGILRVRQYGIFLAVAFAVLHGLAFFSIQWVERNEIRQELIQWSQTLPKPDPTQQEKELHLPEDILALHVDKLERTGFYEMKTDKSYLAYANPENDYILAKSEESALHEVWHFATILGMLFVGDMILLLGWWRFTRSKVRELFEVA
jgi:predicted outer membrane lipoprotein